MAPKEKAMELVGLYWKAKHQPFNYEHAKQCALIAVNEIMKVGINPIDLMYWDEVKREIENI